jgi:hypothetical protein
LVFSLRVFEPRPQEDKEMKASGLSTLASLLIVAVAANASDRASASRPSSFRAATQPIAQAELTGSDTQQYSFLGSAVAVSGDTVVVGAPGINDGNGNYVPAAAYVFVEPASGWRNMHQVAKLTPSDNGEAYAFGFSVAISGNTIVIGSDFQEAYVFVKPQTGWVDMTETARLEGSATGTCFCGTVAIDGDTVVVGSPFDSNNFGSAYVFVKPASGWRTTSRPNARLTQSVRHLEDSAFSSVAISGHTIVGVGVVHGSINVGAVFLFTKPAGGWTGNLTQTVTLYSTQSFDYFKGGTVSVSGNTVAAGSPSPNLTYFPPAFVDVWVRPGSGWVDMTETAQLSDGNTTTADEFGISTIIVGNTIIAGTPYHEPRKNQFRGIAYTFVKPAGGWKTTSKFNAALRDSNGTNDDGFGSSVALSAGTIVVGAPFGPTMFDVGAAYVFGK